MGTALAFPDRLVTMASKLNVEDFGDPRLGAVWEAMLDLSREGTAIDPVTVAMKLRAKGVWETIGDMDFLVELLDRAKDEDTKHLVQVVRREARGRRLEGVLRQGLEELVSGKDPDLTQSRLGAEITRIGYAYTDEVEDSLRAICTELAVELDEEGPRGFGWPWKAMDHAVGYLVPGRVWAISGFSGSGKSTFLRATAMDLALAGTKVAYFSIEETGKEVLGLMSCALSGVSYTRFGQGRELTVKVKELIRDGMTEIFNSHNLIINERKLWDPAQLLARIRFYAEQYGVKVVVIDHAHLIRYPAKNSDEKQFWIAEFAIQLAALCKQVGVVALVAYQPKKPGEGGDIFRPVSPDEIRGTSEIWNIVYNTLSPYRPWVKMQPHGAEALGADGLPVIVKPYDEKNPGAPVRNYAYVEPGKQRIGGFGGRPVVFRFDEISGRIYDL